MRPGSGLTRRQCVGRFAGALGAALLGPELAAAWQHARESLRKGPSSLSTLSADDARDIEALAEQILPSTDTAGAREAGVIYFVDRALGTFDKALAPLYRDGLAAARRLQRERFPSAANIAALPAADQRELLRSIEKTEFFAVLRDHTVLGFLGSPKHGGNEDEAGWRAIGFEDRHVFEPPFGYYDDPRNSREEP